MNIDGVLERLHERLDSLHPGPHSYWAALFHVDVEHDTSAKRSYAVLDTLRLEDVRSVWLLD